MAERRERHSSSARNINDLPVEVIGHILSHVRCVRLVALACATCRKWRDAVKNHLYKITCPFQVLEPWKWKKYEHTITAVVKQTAYLQELSVINGEIRADSLRVWLKHTRRTLKSFTFLSKTSRGVNILKMLADSKSSVERLEWGDANLPALNLAYCNLPSLVLLTLDGGTRKLSIEEIQLLFSSLLKLENASLINIVGNRAPSRVVFNLSSSLKTLIMKRVSLDRGDAANPIDTTLALCADNLSHFSLMGLSVNELLSVEVEQVKSLQCLIIQDFDIVRLRFAETLQRLVIWNASIKQMESKNLMSLTDLTLFKERDLRAIWPIYKITTQEASTKLRKLRLLGGLPTFAVEDLRTIACRFPKLRWLALYHQDTLFGQSEKKLPMFRQLIDLELYVNNRVTDHEVFAGWILKLLQCCPNLKCMAIKLEHRPSEPWAEEIEFPLKLTSVLRNLIRPYPYVQVRLTTKHPNQLNEIFSRSYWQTCVDMDLHSGNNQSVDFCVDKHYCIWLLVLRVMPAYERP
ncbi:hypothetical protein GOP47_0024107 [Adiantum capillus-veneris]|uniref:F-box domain-containing protein n=1 Tax=Adiantum capillus-veneris TaxID=13818 RepID=A0A9D4U5X0_ADICA|nr:hypothetical protein GOP47_0024107 [Adiantum capillus-veneris]